MKPEVLIAGMCCEANWERVNGRSEASHSLECLTDTMDFALSEKRQMDHRG